MRSSGALIVSWDFSLDKDTGILIIGEKTPNRDNSIDIINAFEGKEAIDLYKKLTTANIRREIEERSRT